MSKVYQLIQLVEKMDQGEKVYINAVSMSPGAVSQLRQYIKDKVIMPDMDIVKKMYEDVETVMSGTVILPQMNYIKS